MELLIPPSNISPHLLRELLSVASDEQRDELLREHPELREYNRVVLPMLQALRRLLSVIGSQLLEDDATSVEEIANWEVGSEFPFWADGEAKRKASRRTIPMEISRAVISQTEDPLDALDVYLTLVVSIDYPDYLTEESYWLCQEIDGGPYAKFIARCANALKFCLERGIHRQWILDRSNGAGEP